MKKHITTYREFFDLAEQDTIICEWCMKALAVDVNHLIPRGMGGKNPRVDFIENLVGMCRPCHMEFEAKRISKEDLEVQHLAFMKWKRPDILA